MLKFLYILEAIEVINIFALKYTFRNKRIIVLLWNWRYHSQSSRFFREDFSFKNHCATPRFYVVFPQSTTTIGFHLKHFSQRIFEPSGKTFRDKIDSAPQPHLKSVDIRFQTVTNENKYL